MADYDLIILGAGPGGYVAAIRAAQLGMKTAIVEQGLLGGTCVNRGCIPAKTLLHSAELYQQAQTSQDLGVTAREVTFDFAQMHRRRAQVSETLRGGVEKLLKANRVTRFTGRGTILGPGQVQVTGEGRVQALTGDKILIATGSIPSTPPIPGLDLPGVVTSDGLMEGEPAFARSLVIIGGGVIGVEIASIYSALGCQVTIVEALDRILATLDREISQSLTMLFKRRGLKLFTGCSVKRIEPGQQEALRCVFAKGDSEQSVEAQAVLVAVGRKANTQGLFGSGVSPTLERGRILVDEAFQTSIPGIYAVGDVSSKTQLAHAASAQGMAAVEGMANRTPEVRADLVPACVYTSPEIASVGITADEAKAAGIPVKTGKFVMSANGRTLIDGADRGFIKVVAQAETGKVLGAQMMCQRATDLVSIVTQAIVNGLSVEQMHRVMFPHPTFAEGLGEALEAVEGSSIHTVRAM